MTTEPMRVLVAVDGSVGSVARNVLHHAPCSVLVVREPRSHQATTAPAAA